ncbi:hypothetical protein [Actinocrispum sp. NPDC049592]|uniref:hypothetical protein n=1 Tax=Actinocrispum sp. NPDC049592 TaxID=3154835 RepID=UPI003444851E
MTGSWGPWATAAKAAETLQQALVDLRLNRVATIEGAKAELGGGSRRDALTILRFLGTDVILELLDPLLKTALSESDTLAVRELLGRLPHDRAAVVVPPAVSRLLTEEDDGDAYRRMAELLHHLGLTEALAQLCRTAHDSIDPDVRDVASDFG